MGSQSRHRHQPGNRGDDFMNVSDFFLGFKKLGIHIQLIDNDLKIFAPKGSLTMALIAEIKERKGEIVAFLKRHGQRRERYGLIEPGEEKDYYVLSSAQKRLYILHQMDKQGTGYNMPFKLELESRGAINKNRLENTFQYLAQRHESLRTSFDMIGNEPIQRINDKVEFEIEYYNISEFEVKEERSLLSEGTRGLAPLSLEPAASSQQQAASTIKNFIRPFDLSRAPLLRVGLVQWQENRYFLLVDMHHIISDGTSIEILTQEFMTVYAGKKSHLPVLEIQYKDYACWQTNELHQEVIKQQKEYWIKEFEIHEEVPGLDLPIDFPRPSIQAFEGETLGFEIGSKDTDLIKNLVNEEKATLYMVLLAIYTIFLAKLSSQEDIIIGTPIAGRRQAQTRNILGIFINTLALRLFPIGEITFKRFLDQVVESSLAAFANQDYPYEELVEVLAVKRDTSRNPLFDTMFALQNVDIPGIQIPGLKVKPYPYEIKTAKFDLLLTASESEQGLLFTFEYSTKLFCQATIQRFSQCFVRIIHAATADKEIKLSQIEIITPKEKEKILKHFNDNRVHYPKNKTLHQLFEEQVEKTPDHSALVGKEERWKGRRVEGKKDVLVTYKKLNEKADQLAQHLIDKGIQTHTIVAIIMERSLEMVKAILAILKTGAAYLPIDPRYPQVRVRYMLNDSAAGGVIVGPTYKDNLKHHCVIELADDSMYQTLPTDKVIREKVTPGKNLLYIIYTSGSSGRPKGVPIQHRSFINFVYSHRQVFGEGPGERMSQVSGPGFDAMALEVWPCILSGASLVIADQDTRLDPVKMKQWLIEKEITISFQTTVIAEQLLMEKWPKQGVALKFLQTGGEQLVLYPQSNLPFRFYNLYGPTEDSVVTTWTEISVKGKIDRQDQGYPPIGKPIANHQVYILGPDLQLQPLGVWGELCIGGAGLAPGYLNRPELTTGKFCLRRPGGALFVKSAPVKHPDSPCKNFSLRSKGTVTHDNELSPGDDEIKKTSVSPVTSVAKSNYMVGKNYLKPYNHVSKQLYSYHLPHYLIYRTGDLARWLMDGNIEFSGRIDSQVKIRGFRIELGEIERQLLTHNQIKDAVVIERSDHTRNKYLCAYVVFQSPQSSHWPGSSELKLYLSQSLPHFMIPLYFVQIDHIPLTLNGKLDRKALPGVVHKPGDDYAPPGNEIEKKLINIWSGILNIDKAFIGINENFFHLGGHSLKATILVSRIHRDLHIKVPLVEVFRLQTIKELAVYLHQAVESRYVGIEPVEKKEHYDLSSAQKRLYFLQQMDLESTAYNIPLIFPVGKEIDKYTFETVLKKLIARHESLRSAFIKVNDIPVQRVYEPEEIEFTIQYYDLQVIGTGERCKWEFVCPFDLSRAPLIRSAVVKQAEGNYTWQVDIHHIVSDGTSHMVLAEDFMRLYKEKAVEPEPLKLQYKDFSQWQNHLFESDEIEAQRNYWKEVYQGSGEFPRLQLPMDYNRPGVFTFAGDHFGFILERTDASAFKTLGTRNGATLYMSILTVLNVLFYKITSQTDIVIGTGIAGRPHADLQGIIGMFVNTLVMRNYPHGEKTYEFFLKEVAAQSVEAFENQDVQFEELVEKLEPQRDPARNPLFDISMVVQNFKRAGASGFGPGSFHPFAELTSAVEKSSYEDAYKNTTSKFDMTFFIHEDGHNIVVDIEYYTAIFKKETIQRLASYFINLVKTVIISPFARLKDIDIISAEEKNHLLYELNNTVRTYPRDKTIPGLFADQVERTPDHTALVGKDESWLGQRKKGKKEEGHITYKQLNERANQLANYLVLDRQIQQESPVGILLERSIHQVVSLLGVLKSGGAYLPLDPSLPEKRIKKIIADARVGIIISQKRFIRDLNRLQWECGTFDTFLCLDSTDIYSEKEIEKSELMDEKLWDYVAESATDEITGGGWFSSYKGEPFSKKEMEEYGDNIIKKLLPLLHQDMRVLEIGCGSGISMYRIASRVGFFYGTDLSNFIIAYNKKRVKEEGHKNITLCALPAHEIDKLDQRDFDLVIINSVIQSFHGHNYLKQVLGIAIDMLKQRGYLFIGDIPDQDLKAGLIKEMTRFKYSDKGTSKTKTDWSADLFVSRSFFEDLSVQWREISNVEFSEKIYTIENELTKFRYDVLITIDKLRKEEKIGKPKSRKKYQHDGKALDKFTGVTAEIAVNVKPGNLAYVIYTSGSTGSSKGVTVAHRNVLRLVKNANYIDYIDLKGGERFLLTGAFAFDISTFEIWGFLLNGIYLYMVDKDVILEGERLQEEVVKHGVSIMHFIPQLFNQLAVNYPGIFAALDCILIGGDMVSARTVSRVKNKYNHLKILHMYGPTENTTFSTYFPVESDYDTNIPIGKPVSNSTVYILNKYNQFQPIGVVGELCTGGDGVARGYLNNPELTNQKFCLRRPGGRFLKKLPCEASGLPRKNFLLKGPHKDHMQSCNQPSMQPCSHVTRQLSPHHPPQFPITPSPHHLIYKTGDLARWLPDSNLEFLGRADFQVKIRGFRVELEEIRSQLLKHELISDVVVIDRQEEDEGKYLCAYFVSKITLELSELNDFLSHRLPDYMIPSYFLPIDKIPVNPNGKVDRKALPAPEAVDREEYAPPLNDLEKKLVEIWSEVLGGRIVIGLDDNFFEIGGHSLKATILTAKIHKELGIKVLLAEIFKYQTIRELSGYLQRVKGYRDEYISIEPVEKKEYYILSSAQQRLYILQQMETNNINYNSSLVVLLEGKLDKLRFGGVFLQLIYRHESLRTSFHMENEVPVQVVQHDVEFAIEYDRSLVDGHWSLVNYQGRGEVPSDVKVEKIIKNFIRPFDLSCAPLLRVGLIELPYPPAAIRGHHRLGTYISQEEKERKYVLMLDMHHIITDGTSHGILLKEFMALFTGEKLLPLKLGYKDYSQWQNSDKQRKALKIKEEYWLKQFGTQGDIPVLTLPYDYPRPLVQGFAGHSINFEIGKADTELLKVLALKNETTLYMLVLSIYTVFLSKLSGQEDIIVGTPTAGRWHADLQEIIGVFINTLALRNFPTGEKSFKKFLEEVKQQTLEVFENQEYQFEELVEKVEIQRDASRNPLFDTMFALQNLDIPGIDIRGLKLKPYDYENKAARFDLFLQCCEVKKGLLFNFEYCTALFREETIRRFIGYIKRITTAVLEDSQVKLSKIEILADYEKKQLMFDFNDTETGYPGDKTIHELFENQADQTLDRVALVTQSQGRKAQGIERNKERQASYAMSCALTYWELKEKSDQLAQFLKEKGIQPDTIVGIMVERSLEMIIGIMAILISGGAYLPIDPDYPEDRIKYMLKYSKVKYLIKKDKYFSESFVEEAIEIIFINEVINNIYPKGASFPLHLTPWVNAPATSLAYIIYTSGSTGNPKGVLVEHRSVVNILLELQRDYPLMESDVYLFKTPYLFDVSVTELFGWFWRGGRLVVMEPGDQKDPLKILEAIKRYHITHINFVPSMFGVFVGFLEQQETHGLGGLKYIFLAGEALQPELVHRFRSLKYDISLENLYGPTEGTIYASGYSISQWTGVGSVPIGKPLANLRLYILNQYHSLQPVRIAGELCISGHGVARGYLNNPELTADKFDYDLLDYHDYHHGHHMSSRSYKSYIIYKTGDLARWLGDGNIEFLGRKDHQVKIRGFRIEIGEIESRILNHDKIKETVVVDRVMADGDRYLCAYIVSIRIIETLGIKELREYLSRTLPDYMIPSYFVPLDRIPRTVSGKIDRKALPTPEMKDNTGEYKSPRTPLEKKLVEMWAAVLGTEKKFIGINSNFFQLGGHSLKATILAAKIHKEYGIKVTLAEIFKSPTIKGMSFYIKAEAKDSFAPYTPIPASEKKEYYPLSSTQERFYILQRVTPEGTAYNMTALHQLEGYVEKERFEHALNALIERHESLRTSFQLISSQPVQRIHEKVEFEINYHDFQVTGTGDTYSWREERSAARKSQPVTSSIKSFIRSFDLSQAPLLRLGLIKLEEEKHILMFDLHHIITDGTSISIFLKEFMILYSSVDPEPLRLQYKDFAQWQYNRLITGELAEQETYWLKRFSGELPVLNMPTDFPRPAVQSFEGNRFHFTLEKSFTGCLNRLIKETRTTLNIILLAVYNILLSRYTGQEDIIIGTTIAGRAHPDLENIIGLLIETLALRNYPLNHQTFDEFLIDVKQGTLDAYENQDYPFKELIKGVGAENEISRNPVFDAMLIVQNVEVTDFELEGLRFSPYQPSPGLTDREESLGSDPEGTSPGEVYHMSKVDFTIEAIEAGEEIHFQLEYCTRLYKRDTMDRFAQHFINIIKEVINNPLIQLSAVQVISQEEKNQLLKEFNDTIREYTPGKMVHELFADQAKKTPDNIAIVGPLPLKSMTYISYRELNGKTDQLAHLLIEKGVQPDTIVGIMVETSLEMVIGLLGILKSGGAYLPVDPGYPEERINYMMADSGAEILLKDNDFTPKALNNCTKRTSSHLRLSSWIYAPVTSLAYIIYTSGTTGRPKGVLVEHRNLTAYIDAFENEFDPGEDDVVIQQVSYAFDAFVEELYPILLKGGKLVIPRREVIKDIRMLADFIEKHQISFITCSPQLLNELNNFLHQLVSLRILISGGDRLKAEYIKKLMEVGEVYNTYGPTESTVCVTYYRCAKDREFSSNVPIGKPITNYRVYILDKYLNLLPVGVSGELCAAGDGVTRGYLNRPELTNKKFCLRQPGALFEKTAPGPCKNFSLNLSHKSYMSYIYKTGDLARWLPDGNIEFLGRIDRQVKIRGYRIELGEIETQLMALKEIKKAVVIERERKSGQNYLTAYLVVDTNGDQKQILDTAGIKQRLARQLPGYMIPPYIVEIDEIPLTSSGKADPKRLPLVDGRDVRPDQPFTAPQSKNEKIVARVWKEVLELDSIGLDDNFFDLGGNSLDIFKVSTRINRIFNKQIPVVSLFQHSTARLLARYLQGESGKGEISREKQDTVELEESEKTTVIDPGTHRTALEIAVIGMAGIFPGAPNIEEFWENLKNGIESITFFADDELKSEGVEDQLLGNSNYVKARGIIEGVEYFDSSFFGFAPVEAQIMDPQIRVFLQCVWHALEHAGYDPFSYDRPIGLYAGASPNLNWEGLASFTSLNQGLSGFMVAQLADKDFMCTHISYKLNLKGPAVSIQTACSTTLVAIHWAVQGLLNGECEMALAGGVSISYPPKRGYIYQEGMIFSNDAHNRTFAVEARGSIFGDGVGAVVLKPLANAAADGDHIYAIIKGTAINNDGFRKVGYTAPSVEGQAEVVKAAQLMAEVKPGSITYIEAHGTATPLGDTVEIEALKQAFNTNEKNYCGIGTVKSNVGHLYSAAGVAGFIKTVLALNHRLIPPSLHFKTPNPEIDFDNSPFYVNTTLKEWKSNNGNPLRAGVSSFGIGGTNAHIILEEAPAAPGAVHMAQEPLGQGRGGVCPPTKSRQYQLMLLSAKTPTALDKMTENLTEYFKKNLLNHVNYENPTNPGPTLADMAYTLQVGRKHFPFRRVLVCPAQGTGIDNLSLYINRIPAALVREENPPIIFMFCGQGSQYVNMGIDLYRTEPIFREEMDRCFEILNTLVDYDLKEILYPHPDCRPGSPGSPCPPPPLDSPLERGGREADGVCHSPLESSGPQGRGVSDIHQTEITQPLVFAFEYALARLLIRWGIKPWAMIGYSFGEYIAACISGVFSLEDALKLVIIRGRLAQQTPAGAMTSVPLPEEKLKPLLNKDLSLAIVNGPTCIVSGAREAVTTFEKEMKRKRVICVPLNMSQAIHSGIMESIRQEFQHSISRFRLNPPQIPYISNVTAHWITGEEAANPKYWGNHLCSTVRFSDGLKVLLKQDNAIFIEIGAGRILGMMVRTHPDKKPGHMVLNTVKHQQEKVTDDYFLLDKVGQLWLQGQRIDWKAFYKNEKRYRVPLPGYPFEGKRYWQDPNINPFQIGGEGQTPLLSRESQPAPGSYAAPGTPGGLKSQAFADETHEPPRNKLEQKLARMWHEYMGVEKVSIHDDFFYLNGNSLIATQLMAQLRQEYQVEIPANRFYENPTIAHLAEIINGLLGKK
jgi:amino acid adenylation domain-containing protein